MFSNLTLHNPFVSVWSKELHIWVVPETRLFFVPIKKIQIRLHAFPHNGPATTFLFGRMNQKYWLARLTNSTNITNGDAHKQQRRTLKRRRLPYVCRILRESYAKAFATEQPSSVNKIDQDRTYTTVLTLIVCTVTIMGFTTLFIGGGLGFAAQCTSNAIQKIPISRREFIGLVGAVQRLAP